MRKYVVGAIIGAALMFGIQAGAAGIVGSKVAGTKDVTLNGTTVGQAVIINNSSYLPVRSLSNALDLGIDLSGGRINLSEQEQSSASVAPSATPTPTPSPSSAPSSTELDDINAKLDELYKQGRKLQDELIQYNLDGITNPNDPNLLKKVADAKQRAEVLKSQIEALEKRKAELQTILGAPVIVPNG